MRAARTFEPLRVLSVGNVYPPHLLGGYEVIWRGVMRQLRNDGHVARVLTTDFRRPDVPAGAPEDPDVHRELRWYWRDHEWPAIGIRERLEIERHNAAVFDRHLADLRPDVVTWWGIGGMSLSMVERVRRAGVPALFFVLDPWTAYGPQRDLWTRMWAHRPAAARIVDRITGIPTQLDLARAGRWLFCSESMRGQTRVSGLALDDDAILSPGVESDYLAVPRQDAPPPWRWRMLYLGRIVEQKGVRTAIASLASLPAEATLTIIGPGDAPYRRELDELVASSGLGERVRFEPPRDRAGVIEAYRDADVVVFPVEWAEPFGLVPLESMAVGRPVIATGQGGSGDFLRDRENCLVFAPGDAGALARAVEALAADPGLRERLVAGGYRTAAAHGEAEFNRRSVDEIAAAARGAAAGRGPASTGR